MREERDDCTGETIGFVVRYHLIEIPNSARIRFERPNSTLSGTIRYFLRPNFRHIDEFDS